MLRRAGAPQGPRQGRRAGGAVKMIHRCSLCANDAAVELVVDEPRRYAVIGLCTRHLGAAVEAAGRHA